MPNCYAFAWHNDACVRSQVQPMDEKTGRIQFFCTTHNQWAWEVPAKTEIVRIFTYGDGRSVEKTSVKHYEEVK